MECSCSLLLLWNLCFFLQKSLFPQMYARWKNPFLPPCCCNNQPSCSLSIIIEDLASASHSGSSRHLLQILTCTEVTHSRPQVPSSRPSSPATSCSSPSLTSFHGSVLYRDRTPKRHCRHFIPLPRNPSCPQKPSLVPLAWQFSTVMEFPNPLISASSLSRSALKFFLSLMGSQLFAHFWPSYLFPAPSSDYTNCTHIQEAKSPGANDMATCPSNQDQ